jgi:hypothetical protein
MSLGREWHVLNELNEMSKEVDWEYPPSRERTHLPASPIEVGHDFGAAIYSLCATVAGWNWTATVATRGVQISTVVLNSFSRVTDRGKRLHRIRNLAYKPADQKTLSSHSHPGCAHIRAEASKFIDTVGKALGSERYDISISARERKRGIRGNRSYRTAKDLLSDAQDDYLLKGDLVTMIDTDAHLDYDTLAGYAGHDFCLYTLCPDALAGHGPESSWRFASPDIVVEDVSGGATYTHKVWDWGKDQYVFSKWGITYVYDPIVVDLAEARQVVTLLLARTIYLPLWFVNFLVPGIRDYRPERMKVETRGNYVLGMFGPPGRRKVNLLNTTLPDATPAKVSADDWTALDVMSRIKSPDARTDARSLSVSSIERYFEAQKIEVPKAVLYMLSDYFSDVTKPLMFTSYQSKAGLSTETGTPYVTVTAPGIVPPACGPVASDNNDKRALEKRLDAVQNLKEFPPDIIEYAKEFVLQMVPGKFAGTMVPVSYEQVATQQPSAAQRSRRGKDYKNLGLDRKHLSTSGFMKKEAGGSVTDPRTINQVPVHQTTTLSMFCMAAKQYVKDKHQRWYGPCKNRDRMAASLRALYRAQGELTSGDYSRMDGRTSIDYRKHVVEPVYLRMFADRYKPELEALLKRERTASVSMQSGHKTKTKGANLSGSPLTTDCNTYNSAFNEFAARRRNGQTPEEAFASLGLYFGDDSVFEAGLAKEVAKVASDCGMVMTFEDRPQGSLPGRVAFLSRIYPDISSTLASYPCIVRALRKLPTMTANKGTTTAMVVAHRQVKGMAANRVDGHVPVYGPYARLLQDSGPELTDKLTIAVLNGNKELNTKMALPPSDIVLDGDTYDLFIGSIARDLAIPPEEVLKLDTGLRNATFATLATVPKLEGWDIELPSWAVWIASDDLPHIKTDN